MRRSKQVRFRRQRVPVEVPTDEAAAEEAADDPGDSEKIEVHVHVHRGESSKRRAKRLSPTLRGKLFDWQWYEDQLSKRPQPATDSGWWAGTTCSACDVPIPSSVRHCPRCGAPRSRRHVLPIVMAVMGLGAFAVLLALCMRILGGSAPEAQAPAPVGSWSDDDVVIVEVPPAAPSPFGSTYPGNGAPSPGGSVATR